MQDSVEDFKAALRNFASGVTVITSIDEAGQPVGATVSAFSSVSADPPTVLVCLNNASRSAAAVRHSGVYSVHILSREHVELAKRFSFDQSEKFPNGEYVPGATGAPALLECDIRLDCEVISETTGGTHGVFMGRVHNIVVNDIDPLVYANRAFCEARGLDLVTNS